MGGKGTFASEARPFQELAGLRRSRGLLRTAPTRTTGNLSLRILAAMNPHPSTETFVSRGLPT